LPSLALVLGYFRTRIPGVGLSEDDIEELWLKLVTSANALASLKIGMSRVGVFPKGEEAFLSSKHPGRRPPSY
jgi:hypothetical protein